MHPYGGTNGSSRTRTQRKAKMEWMCQACCYICAGHKESCPVCGAAPAASAQEMPFIMAPAPSNTSPTTSPKFKGNSKSTAKVTRRKMFIKKSSQEPTTPTATAGGVDKSLKKSPALNNVKLVRRKKITMFRREDDSVDAASEQPVRAYRRSTSPVPPRRPDNRPKMQPRAASPIRHSDRPTRASPRHTEFVCQPDNTINVEINNYDDDVLENRVPAPVMRDLRPVRSNFYHSQPSENQEQGNPHHRSESSLTIERVFYPSASLVPAVTTSVIEEPPPVQPQHCEVEQEQPIPHLNQEEELGPISTPPRPTLQQRHQQQEDNFLGWTPEEQQQSWVCGACTFENENPLYLTCSLCSTLRVKDYSHRASSSNNVLHAEEPLGDGSQEAAIRSRSQVTGEDWLETLQQRRIQELIEIQEELLQEYHQ